MRNPLQDYISHQVYGRLQSDSDIADPMMRITSYQAYRKVDISQMLGLRQIFIQVRGQVGFMIKDHLYEP